MSGSTPVSFMKSNTILNTAEKKDKGTPALLQARRSSSFLPSLLLSLSSLLRCPMHLLCLTLRLLQGLVWLLALLLSPGGHHTKVAVTLVISESFSLPPVDSR